MRALGYQRERDDDLEPAALGVAEGEMSPVLGDEALGDAETETEIAWRSASGGIQAVVGFEEAGQLVFGDARSVIAHGTDDVIARRVQRDFGVASVGERVVENVVENAAQLEG